MTIEPVQPTVKVARTAGALYLLLIVTSLSAFIYTGALIVPEMQLRQPTTFWPLRLSSGSPQRLE